MIDVVDFGGGNLGSLLRAMDRLDAPCRTVSAGRDLARSSRPVVLPGVGAFGAVMDALAARGLDTALCDAVAAGRPLLGICVGLQVLFERSEESPGVPGLGILEGDVVRFRKGKVPHVGWSRVVPRRKGAYGEGYAYFVNAYHARPCDPGAVLYESDHHGPFCAAVQAGPVTAFQFHPEKSGPFGASVLAAWLATLRKER